MHGDGKIQPIPGKPPWITASIVRSKNRHADLKRNYRRVMAASSAITLLLHLCIAVAFPAFEFDAPHRHAQSTLIQIEDIPETRQVVRPPPPPRPSVPLEAEAGEVPDRVTIEPTELSPEDLPIGVPALQAIGIGIGPPFEEDEIFDFDAVDRRPKLVKSVLPDYPPAARRAGREGVVYVMCILDKNGNVRTASVVRGPKIFRRAASETVSRFEFTPAVHEGKEVSVRVLVPIEFRLRR